MYLITVRGWISGWKVSWITPCNGLNLPVKIPSKSVQPFRRFAQTNKHTFQFYLFLDARIDENINIDLEIFARMFLFMYMVFIRHPKQFFLIIIIEISLLGIQDIGRYSFNYISTFFCLYYIYIEAHTK